MDELVAFAGNTRYEYFRLGAKAHGWALSQEAAGNLVGFEHPTHAHFPKRYWNAQLASDYLKAIGPGAEKKRKSAAEKEQSAAHVGKSTINKNHAALCIV